MRRFMRGVAGFAMIGWLLAGCSSGGQGQDGGGSCGDDICDQATENADTCPDDCPAVCPDGFCTHDENADTCSEDCPAVCPDEFCTHVENADTCPEDCPAVCPDGSCTHGENSDTCPDDCSAMCPDGYCTHTENAETCPDDCPAACPDGYCTHDEDALGCPDDCPAVCPDGSCTHGENADTCPDDCPPICPDGFCTHTESTATCNEDCPCDPGPCCDENGMFRGDQTVCGTWPEYRCAGTGCEANAETRSIEQTCSGASSLCDGTVSDPLWQTNDCDDAAEICETDGATYASCTPCETNQACQDGACACEFCGPDVDHCGSIDSPWPDWNYPQPDWNNFLTAYAVPELTGYAGNNGGAGETSIRVGNGGFTGSPPFELVLSGIVTFDISDLPVEAKVHSADMVLYQSHVVGNPYIFPMDDIGVEHIRHDSSVIWGAQDAPVVPGTIGARMLQPANAELGIKGADVTEAVRYELATCQSEVQFRLGWRPQDTDGDGEIDEVHFVDDSGGSNGPYLLIRYYL